MFLFPSSLHAHDNVGTDDGLPSERPAKTYGRLQGVYVLTTLTLGVIELYWHDRYNSARKLFEKTDYEK
jgi:hypothetical protein